MGAGPERVYQVFTRATPDQVWEAITRPELSSRYFHGSKVETTAEPGSPIKNYAPDGTTLWTDDMILEAEPNRRLVHTWRALYDPELAAEPPRRVIWKIEPSRVVSPS